MMKSRARALIALAAATSTLVLSSCSATMEDLPLPKPGVEGESYEVKAVFDNVLNLPNQAKVRVGGTDVGQVTAISTKNFLASITMNISEDVKLPKSTKAELRQTTPLSDVFVALNMSEDPDSGVALLSDGDSLPRESTSAGASVEDLLVSVTTLVQGGAVNALGTIVTQLGTAIGGKDDTVVHLVNKLQGIAGSINGRTEEIDQTLNEAQTLLQTVEDRHAELGNFADSLPSAVATIAANNRNIGDLTHNVSITAAALEDWSNATGDQMVTLVRSANDLMSGIAQMDSNITMLFNTLHEIRPKAQATFEGGNIAVGATISYLSVGWLTDPKGSRFLNIQDVNSGLGSLLQVVQQLYGRANGGYR